MGDRMSCAGGATTVVCEGLPSRALHELAEERQAAVVVPWARSTGGHALIALIASQRTLDDAWTAVRDLPLLAEGVAFA
jgi:hypothetical protein